MDTATKKWCGYPRKRVGCGLATLAVIAAAIIIIVVLTTRPPDDIETVEKTEEVRKPELDRGAGKSDLQRYRVERSFQIAHPVACQAHVTLLTVGLEPPRCVETLHYLLR